MTSTKQFTLYSVTAGPNPWKVAIVLNELGLQYHTVYVDMMGGKHKQPEYLSLNPNGRMPTLIDHSNNDFTVWESGAIIQYLTGKYDTGHTISFPDFTSESTAVQWLMFQISGQGPYFGQYVHFAHRHPVKHDSAIARYRNEVDRIPAVLESVLVERDWLVGDKCSFADLAFVPWQWMLDYFVEIGDWRGGFPRVADWDRRLNERVVVLLILSPSSEYPQSVNSAIE